MWIQQVLVRMCELISQQEAAPFFLVVTPQGVFFYSHVVRYHAGRLKARLDGYLLKKRLPLW
jgi:hypothetical protein